MGGQVAYVESDTSRMQACVLSDHSDTDLLLCTFQQHAHSYCAELIRECSVLTSPIVTNGLIVHLVCVCTSRTMSLPHKVVVT